MLALAVLAIFAASASKYFFTPQALPLDISGRHGGTYIQGSSNTHDYTSEITEELLINLPKWDRTKPNPPVSANDAMLIAQEYRDGLVARRQFPGGSHITAVQLAPWDPKSGTWVWRIEFTCVQYGNPIEHIEVAVLMDRSVVKHKIKRRVDTGWPPPDTNTQPHNSGLTDTEVISKFVENLNIDRQFAGQIVKVTGIVERIPEDHEHRKSGKYRHLKTSDGHNLIFWFPHGVPKSVFENEITVTGKLLGFRDLDNRSESWDDLKLFPGIRGTGLGR